MSAFSSINTQDKARAAVQGAMYAAAHGNAFTNTEVRNAGQLVQVIAGDTRLSVGDIVREVDRHVGPGGIDANHWSQVKTWLGQPSFVRPHNGPKPGLDSIRTQDAARAAIQGMLYVASGDKMTNDEIRAAAQGVEALGIDVESSMRAASFRTGPGQIDRNHFNRLVRELKDRGSLPFRFRA